MYFLFLSLFPAFYSPLCCDLSSGIQVNKCHIFQPIFTLGNVPSPSPLSCFSGFCYHCDCSPPPYPTLPDIPSLTPNQSLTPSINMAPAMCQAPCRVLREERTKKGSPGP